MKSKVQASSVSRKIEGIVVHRTEAGFDGATVNRHERPNSYHAFIAANGRVDQMLPYQTAAAHACKFNATTIAIALYGDFAPEEKSRNSQPTIAQIDSLIKLCQQLQKQYGPLWIKGHTELGPDGTAIPSKLTSAHACPGSNLNLDILRGMVGAPQGNSTMDPLVEPPGSIRG